MTTIWDRKKEDLERLLNFYRKAGKRPLYVSTTMNEAELDRVTRKTADGKWIYDGFNLVPGRA